METSLPIYPFRQRILQSIDEHHITIIEGSTGCGKSTQVPQYILAHEQARNVKPQIIITQPRKVAAMYAANRISRMNKWALGTRCGYQVGLDSQRNESTEILFCTTGVLLQKLINSKSLCNFTHIIIDEVHERDKETDFCMLLVRKFLAFDHERRTKVIMMSATLEGDRILDYFTVPYHTTGEITTVNFVKTCNILSNFPVTITYIDDHVNAYRENDIDLPPLSMKSEAGIIDSTIFLCCHMIHTFIEGYVAERQQGQISTDQPLGAVLVFLPGMGEILRVKQSIEESYYSAPFNRPTSIFDRLKINLLCIPFHSDIGQEDQRKAFMDAPPDSVKIILATNIAESSITISDAILVIDFCLCKVNMVDRTSNFPALRLCWCAQANMRQRAGRVGRTQPGRVVRLITKHQYEETDEFKQPDMCVSPITDTILMAKRLNIEAPAKLLCDALDAPNQSDINQAVLFLKEILALTNDADDEEGNGKLTPLGYVLSHLPLDVRLAKLIVAGYLFGIMTDCVSVAAALASKPFFRCPLDKWFEAFRVRIIFAQNSHSDCIALKEAMSMYENMTGNNLLRSYIHRPRIREAITLKNDLLRRLSRLGLTELPSSFYTNLPEHKAELWAAKRNTLFNLAMSFAFYPHYFKSSTIDASCVRRDLSDFPHLTTVELRGLPQNRGFLYHQDLQKLFSQCCFSEDQRIKITYEQSRAYLQFTDLERAPDNYSASVHLALNLFRGPNRKYNAFTANTTELDQWTEWQQQMAAEQASQAISIPESDIQRSITYVVPQLCDRLVQSICAHHRIADTNHVTVVDVTRKKKAIEKKKRERRDSASSTSTIVESHADDGSERPSSPASTVETVSSITMLQSNRSTVSGFTPADQLATFEDLELPDKVTSLTPVLPGLDIQLVELNVVFVDTCTHFWAQYADYRSQETVQAIEARLATNPDSLPKIYTKRLSHRQLVVAPYDSMLYRAEFRGFTAKGRCHVKYVDYGNTGSVEVASLRQIPSELMTIPYQAVECFLIGLVPSGLMDAATSREGFQGSVLDKTTGLVKPINAHIYSVVDNAIRCQIIKKGSAIPTPAKKSIYGPVHHDVKEDVFESTSLNAWLLKEGYAERRQESHASIFAHRKRVDHLASASSASSQRDVTPTSQSKTHVRIPHSFVSCTDDSSLPKIETKQNFQIRGPFHPCVVTWMGLPKRLDAGSNSVSTGSVNTQALHQKPGEEFPHFMVAAQITQNASRPNSRLLHITSMFPARPGLGTIVPMLFAPSIQLISGKGRKTESALFSDADKSSWSIASVSKGKETTKPIYMRDDLPKVPGKGKYHIESKKSADTTGLGRSIDTPEVHNPERYIGALCGLGGKLDEKSDRRGHREKMLQPVYGDDDFLVPFCNDAVIDFSDLLKINRSRATINIMLDLLSSPESRSVFEGPNANYSDQPDSWPNPCDIDPGAWFELQLSLVEDMMGLLERHRPVPKNTSHFLSCIDSDYLSQWRRRDALASERINLMGGDMHDRPPLKLLKPLFIDQALVPREQVDVPSACPTPLPNRPRSRAASVMREEFEGEARLHNNPNQASYSSNRQSSQSTRDTNIRRMPQPQPSPQYVPPQTPTIGSQSRRVAANFGVAPTAAGPSTKRRLGPLSIDTNMNSADGEEETGLLPRLHIDPNEPPPQLMTVLAAQQQQPPPVESVYAYQ